MTPADVLRRWFATADRALLAPGCDWRVSPGYPVPRQIWTGPEEIVDAFFPALRETFPGWAIEVATLLPLPDNQVFAGGTYWATAPGAATPVAIPFMHRWTVRDGRIAAVNAVADFSAAAFSAVGRR